MPAIVEAEACLGVKEVVLLVNVQVVLLVEVGIFVVNELVVVSIGFVIHVAILNIGKGIPVIGEVIESLDEDVTVELLGI